MTRSVWLGILASLTVTIRAEEACAIHDETCLLQVSSSVAVNRSSTKGQKPGWLVADLDAASSKDETQVAIREADYEGDYAIKILDENGQMVEGFMKIARLCAMGIILLATTVSGLGADIPNRGYVISAGAPPSALSVGGPLQEFQQHNYDAWQSKWGCSGCGGEAKAHKDLEKSIMGMKLKYVQASGIYEGQTEKSLVVEHMNDAQAKELLGDFYQDSVLEFGKFDTKTKNRDVELMFSDKKYTEVPIGKIAEGKDPKAQTTVNGKTYVVKDGLEFAAKGG